VADSQLSEDERADIERLTNQRKRLALARIERQNELTKRKHAIRTAGRLPHAEYRKLCDDQQRLVDEMLDIDRKLQPINEKLREYGQRIHASHTKVFAEKVVDDDADVRLRTLLRGIDSLRAKYREFAKDMTRVSSMRAMASAFADECQDLISKARGGGS
jgi:hypothetical protein